VKEYLDRRYISAVESCWRIFKFDTQEHSPAVIRLAIHLPGEQNVSYVPGRDSVEDILGPESRRSMTTLTAFFEACQMHNDDLVGDLLYPDVASRFTWKSQDKKWMPRQVNRDTISRIYYVGPNAGEKYYLRMLLYVVPRPTSFDSLKTVDGVVLDTFQMACSARGLLENDEEWDQCLTEAALIQTGKQLRQLFVTILLGNSPHDARGLFERHVRDLGDDLSYRMRRVHLMPNATITADRINQYVLYEIDQQLQHACGKGTVDFGLARAPTHLREILDGVHQAIPRCAACIVEETNYDMDEMRQLWNEGYPKCNQGQRLVVDTILSTMVHRISRPVV
jgi:hypothetical protein